MCYFNEWRYIIPFVLLIQEQEHMHNSSLLNKKQEEKNKNIIVNI